ncbi:MAG: hypothetical protein PVH54_04160 [Gammaproteobacteria bacterium]|jgi:hypothetical protein
MPAYRTGLMLDADLLIAAMPCVRKNRHPGQKPLAAYLVFVPVFPVVATVLSRLLLWLAARPGLEATLDDPDPAPPFIALATQPSGLSRCGPNRCLLSVRAVRADSVCP